jgi:hypothetical protein
VDKFGILVNYTNLTPQILFVELIKLVYDEHKNL